MVDSSNSPLQSVSLSRALFPAVGKADLSSLGILWEKPPLPPAIQRINSSEGGALDGGSAYTHSHVFLGSL